jgi:hypothetical protein
LDFSRILERWFRLGYGLLFLEGRGEHRFDIRWRTAGTCQLAGPMHERKGLDSCLI